MIEELKKHAMQALKAKDMVKKNVLQVVIGEIETKSAFKSITEEDQQKIVRKIIEANKETIGHLDATDERVLILQREIEILDFYLPQLWDVDQIEAHFLLLESPLLEQIQAAKSDGQAMGMAMKELKGISAPVDGKTVKEWVAKARS